MRSFKNFNLFNYNTFKFQSVASIAHFPETVQELREVQQSVKNLSIIAGGSNIIIFPTIKEVVCLSAMQSKITAESASSFMVTANVKTTAFIKYILSHGFGGVEGLLGIPGTIGGSIVMNSGSSHCVITDHLVSVTYLNEKGFIETIKKGGMRIQRRSTIFQDRCRIIISALFEFKNIKRDDYKIKKALFHRKRLPKEPSAGGLFKNWYALREHANQIRDIKMLNLKVHPEFINIIMNKGNASAVDVVDYVQKVQSIVNVPLNLEVRIIT